jgi:D-proline reductase (dithiol) PrdB
MSPVSYIEITRKAFPDQPPYQWSTFQDAPLTPLKKKIQESRISLISSCGVYHKDQPPFDPIKNDLSFREIPADINPRELMIAHNFYDSTDARQDVNCVLPIWRLKELEEEGFIKTFVSPAYSFMGRVFKRRELQEQMVTALIQKFNEKGVDALLLVPC